MSFGELILLSLLVYLLFGPKKTASIARQLAQTVAGIKRTAHDMKASLAMQSVDLPHGASPDPAIDAQRQTIVGILPAMMTTTSDDASSADAVSAHADAQAPPVGEVMYV